LLCRLDALATLKRTKHLDTSSDQTTPKPRLIQQPVQPELSIVITSHNQGDFLLEAVASAEAACGNRRVELLIVDDGSTEARTVEVLHHLDGLGYRILKQTNKGLPSARNTGIANTSAPILLFLDDDNRLLPPYLEQGLDLMHLHHKIEVVYGNRQEFGTSSKLRRIGRVSPEALWQMNRIDNCSLIRRTLLERTGGYDQSLPAFEDWDLWLTALGQPQGLALGYLDVSCFEYRVRPDSMLQRLFTSKPLQEEVMGILRNKHGSRVGHGGFRTSP
jgi:glycosyltransferase involved in cell wall biosynthesis